MKYIFVYIIVNISLLLLRKVQKFPKHKISTSSVHILDFVLLYTVLGAEKMLNIYFGDNV